MDKRAEEHQEAQSKDVYQVFTPEGEKGLHQGDHVFDHTIRPILK